jgi:hypothetical protein
MSSRYDLLKATLDATADRVRRILADELHDDLCHCDTWPEKCVSDWTIDRFSDSYNGVNATVYALAKIHLLPTQDDNCKICKGHGNICEAHWDIVSCTCGAPDAPCPRCNPNLWLAAEVPPNDGPSAVGASAEAVER